jgi:heme/copper-type cytochrome/quinol oxidase subunit 2
MDHPTSRNENRKIGYTIAALVGILVVLTIFFIIQYQHVRRIEAINAREFEINLLLHHHGTLTANQVSMIRPWMTFDYINKIFGIPPDYLKNQFTITDSSYPKMTLQSYASKHGMTGISFTANVEAAISSYLSSKD